MIIAATTDSLMSNQNDLRLKNIQELVHWCRNRHAMKLDPDSRMFTVDDMSRCREELDMEEDSQPETSINKPEKFKPINWAQWSEEFENYFSQYKTARKAGVLLLYVIHNNLKIPDAEAMALLPQTEQEYWNLTLDNKNMSCVEDSNRVYSLL